MESNDIVTRAREIPRGIGGHYYNIVQEMADEIERLREQLRLANIDCFNMTVERDEARREICNKVAAYSASVTARQWARERGWYCFKEDSRGK